MQKIKIVAVIGIFLFGVFSFGYIYKRMWSRWGKNYSIKVEVQDTGSLAIGTSVFMNGVKIGVVDDVYLGQNSVLLDLSIDKRVKIPIGSQVQITTVGMIGNLKVSIFRPKVSNGYLQDGDVIIGSSPVSTSIILEKAADLASKLNDVLKDLNLQDLSKNVNDIIKTYNENGSSNLIKTIGNIQSVTDDLKEIVKSSAIANSIKNVENITFSLSKLLKIGFQADIEWDINKLGKNYYGEVGFSLGSLFFSKRDFGQWVNGYSLFLKKDIGRISVAAGIMYNSFGAAIDLNLLKCLQFVFKVFNFPDVDYKLSCNIIMKDSIMFGPIYKFKDNTVLFHVGYRVEM